MLRTGMDTAAPKERNQGRDDRQSEIFDMDDPDLLVDEAGCESFPASDPPAWTLGEPAKDVTKIGEKRSA